MNHREIKVIEEVDSDVFESKVNELMKGGWDISDIQNTPILADDGYTHYHYFAVASRPLETER